MFLLKAFLKDQLLDFAGYTGSTVLILIYYYLAADGQLDIIYPVILALFIMILITVIKGIRYFRFYHAVSTADYQGYLLQGASNQERHVIAILMKLHQDYQSSLSDLRKQKFDADAFIAQMAHDIKIPVSVIQLILENMEDSYLSDDNKDKIKSENDTISDKLSQLLCYLRLEQFEKDYLIERVNLVDEVRNAINRKKDYFILNQIFPQFDSLQEPVCILTDRKWHGVLLDQIISNAVKYSAAKKKGGYIRFEIQSSGDFISLVITDYGIGIPPYDMERIFEPFFTGENGRKVGSSSGIGLYLCRSITEKLGHQLSITSVMGETTEVTIRYLSKL